MGGGGLGRGSGEVGGGGQGGNDRRIEVFRKKKFFFGGGGGVGWLGRGGRRVDENEKLEFL